MREINNRIEFELQQFEEMSVYDILSSMNSEDLGVAKCVQENLHSIEKLVNLTFVNLKKGGRVFYLGAGTSGRLGILDASECPPTFGVSHKLFIGLIAGGDKAIRKAVEFAEDDPNLGWKDLLSYNVNQNDTVIGLAASGKTPYVVGALKEAQKNNILTVVLLVIKILCYQIILMFQLNLL